MKIINIICSISLSIIACNPSEIRSGAVSITNSIKNDIESNTNTSQDKIDLALRNKPDNLVSLKCVNCEGSGISTSDVCTNCENWNSEYRNKVACDVCQDTRKIKIYKVLCNTCVNSCGVMYWPKDGSLGWDNLDEHDKSLYKLLKY